jgi:hypothetical protein
MRKIKTNPVELARIMRVPRFTPEVVERLCALIEIQQPESFSADDKASIAHGLTFRLSWHLPFQRNAVSVGWGQDRKVRVGVQYIEGPSDDMLQVSKLLTRIANLAASAQMILDGVQDVASPVTPAPDYRKLADRYTTDARRLQQSGDPADREMRERYEAIARRYDDLADKTEG